MRNIYINITCYILCVFLLFLGACTKKKQTKAEIRKAAPEKTISQNLELRKEKEFASLIEQLKQINPFSKNHYDIDKYRFASGGLSLSGIFYEKEKPLAIINDQVVGEGDMLGEKQVIRITQEEVVLKDKEREYYLKTD